MLGSIAIIEEINVSLIGGKIKFYADSFVFFKSVRIKMIRIYRK